MRKRRCANCAYYHKVEDWYYDECMQGPMTTLPDDPACCMFEPIETRPIDRSKIQVLIDKFKKGGKDE